MTAYLSALAICAASLLVGAALTRPGPARAAAPAVGLAGLMLIVLAAIRLPGHGATAAAAVGLVLLISLARLWPERDLRSVVEGMPVVLGVTALCSLPFLVNGRFGELGVSVLDDISFHLAQADAMRTLGGGAHVITAGYPSGPHAVVAAIADGTGIGVSPAFTGLLIAIPVLTALSAFAVIPGGSRLLRWLGAVVVGLSYLCAGYFVQSAFKETLMALFLLGSALVMRDAHLSRELNLGHVLMIGLITGASVATFGPAGVVWPAAAVVLLGLAETGHRWRTGGPRWRFTGTHAVAAAAALGAAVLIVVTFGSGDFFESGPGEFLTTTGVGGNYAGQLNPLEALGIWSNADFRYAGNAWWQLPGVILAVAVVLHGALWCSTRRREWAVLAGASAAVAIYLVARPTTLAYNSGKALVIAAPILALVAVRALASRVSVSGGTVRRLAIAAFAAYVLLAGYSSTLALRGAHVRPREIGPDLGAFRDVVRGHKTLFLGRDNFAGWELRGSRLWGYQPYRTAVTRLGGASRQDRRRREPAGRGRGLDRLALPRHVRLPGHEPNRLCVSAPGQLPPRPPHPVARALEARRADGTAPDPRGGRGTRRDARLPPPAPAPPIARTGQRLHPAEPGGGVGHQLADAGRFEGGRARQHAGRRGPPAEPPTGARHLGHLHSLLQRCGPQAEGGSAEPGAPGLPERPLQLHQRRSRDHPGRSPRSRGRRR